MAPGGIVIYSTFNHTLIMMHLLIHLNTTSQTIYTFGNTKRTDKFVDRRIVDMMLFGRYYY